VGETSVALVAGLETALNNYLRLDPVTVERLGELSGKVVAVELKGLGIRLYLLPEDHGLCLLEHYEGSPDTLLEGSPLALLRMGRAPDASPALFSGEVRITGDVALGQRFKAILDDMDIDWEEHLSRLSGDVIAHQVGNMARGLLGWARRERQVLAEDVSEYLREEARLLPTRDEVDELLDAVDTLRAHTDRLDARIRRLESAAIAKPGPTDPPTESPE
jgi:ubiquinone biosynthesis protein UbiJ